MRNINNKSIEERGLLISEATTTDCPYESIAYVGAIWNGCPTRYGSATLGMTVMTFQLDSLLTGMTVIFFGCVRKCLGSVDPAYATSSCSAYPE